MALYYELPQTPVSSIINSITLSNGIFDEIIISEDVDFDKDNGVKYFPDEWADTTKLHATFNNTIVAGGLDYDFESNEVENSYFKIQRRLANEVSWTTIGYINSENINIENNWLNASFVDRTATPNEIYEYMITSVQYGDDISSVIIEDITKCWCDGIAISDNDITYYTALEPNINSIAQNRATTVVETLFGKYPYVFKNGELNYASGSASGLFAPMTDDCNYIFDNIENQNVTTKYRKQFREWLCNGKPKILKYYDGKIFLISVTDAPSDDDSEHNYKNITTWSWVEIGDATSTTDLVRSGFIDENII